MYEEHIYPSAEGKNVCPQTKMNDKELYYYSPKLYEIYMIYFDTMQKTFITAMIPVCISKSPRNSDKFQQEV